MELETTLQQLGLEEKEAAVYLTCLQLGKETAFHIAARCGLKRSTVYVILNELNIKGLVTISKTKKAAFYEAVSPRRLLQQLEFKHKQMEDVLPTLLTLYKDKPGKPKIQILEGASALEIVYRESIEYLHRGKEVLAFGSLVHHKTAYKEVLDDWIRALKNKQYAAREVLNDEEFERMYIAKVKRNGNPNHGIRLLPAGTFVNDNLIYGSKLAVFSIQKDLFVTLIESEEIVYTYRALFELAWQAAIPVEKWKD